jgi:hypothetical protein
LLHSVDKYTIVALVISDTINPTNAIFITITIITTIIAPRNARRQ